MPVLWASVVSNGYTKSQGQSVSCCTFKRSPWNRTCIRGVNVIQKALIFVLMSAVVAPLKSSTLLQLSLDDLIRKSTSIVRGKALYTSSSSNGTIIYSHYSVQVSETLKGASAAQIDLSVPGGVASGLRQTYSGSPNLTEGQEYVIFLWSSKSKVTQVIGLSQGLFSVTTDLNGQMSIARAAATERMLNSAGQEVVDSDIKMSLTALRGKIQQVLGSKVAQ